MEHNNAKTLELGFRRGVRLIEAILQKSLMDAADDLLRQVAKDKEFTGFTGNTQLSYACGVYVNGELKHVSFQHNWNGPTIRMKVRKGKVVYLEEPFEGNPRPVKGMVDIVVNHGPELSLQQIEQFRAPRRGVFLLMTTGTEYSTFLDEEVGLNVLTKTKENAPKIIERNWKVIDKSLWERE